MPSAQVPTLPIYAPKPSPPRQSFEAVLNWVGDGDRRNGLEIYYNAGVVTTQARREAELLLTRCEPHGYLDHRLAGIKQDDGIAPPWPPFKAPQFLIPEHDVAPTPQMYKPGASRTVDSHLAHQPSVLRPIGSERVSEQHRRTVASARIPHEASTGALIPVAPFDMDADDDDIDASEVLRWVEAMEKAHIARLLNILLDGDAKAERRAGRPCQEQHIG
ncbi:hypothetical protein ONZ51_g2428 [Trametes cubensis]|uniref:Uncharacterized protein n=1 Tax=Trametes cubensis TaxID=1111947 RepID=A0AAD7U2A2_9APHY|nr:hypothetical protein ONZ51_g2428 [Trametes cubensis]